jgi:hypothetical protein
VVVALDEPQRPQLVQQLPVVRHEGTGVPSVEHQLGVEVRAVGLGGDPLVRAALHLVAEDQQQHVLGVHLPLPRLTQPLRQRGQELAELQLAKDLPQVRRQLTRGHGPPPT